MKRKRCAKVLFDCQMKIAGDGSGTLEGYASTFGNVDRVGDRVVKGAFAKTIQTAVPAGKVSLQVKHFGYGGDLMESVGAIVEAKEDDRGLWIKAEFDDDEQSQAIRQKVQRRLEKGRPVGLSIGYEVIEGRDVTETQDGKTRYVYELTELKLYEVTITLNPANEEAMVTAAKALDEAETPEELGSALAKALTEAFPGMEAHVVLRQTTEATSKTAGSSRDGETETTDADADLLAIESAALRNRVRLARLSADI